MLQLHHMKYESDVFCKLTVAFNQYKCMIILIFVLFSGENLTLYPFVETCVFQVEELYDAYCIQRRLRDGASKMVAAFNSATGSKEARESLSEANKGYRECTEASD